MIIVCGHLVAKSGKRNSLLEQSKDAVRAARQAKGCRDYAVSPDLLDADRVNIFESWDDAAALAAFRGDGPGGDLSALIARYEIDQLEVDLPA